MRARCKKWLESHIVLDNMAEGERFELSDLLQSPVFKTGAFNRSATPPLRLAL